MVKVLSCSVVSNTLQSYGLQPTGLLCPGISWERILEWVGIPFSEDLPNPGIEPMFPTLQVESLPPESPGKR